MPKKQADQELRERVDSFVADLEDLIRQAALEAVQEALAGDGGAARGTRAAAPGRRGRPPGRTSKKAGKKAGKRIRRSAEDLEKLAARILSHVRSKPGQGIEAISRALRTSSKELRRPVQLLLAEGKLRTEGEKRGTTYFAGKGKPSRKASSKKAGRKKAKARRAKAAA